MEDNTLYYSIEFFTYWQCSSGLSSGAEFDSLVIKDKDGMPYVPGKTVKGLLREALSDLNQYSESAVLDIDRYFGKGNDKDSGVGSTQGRLYFSDAGLNEADRRLILSKDLQPYLYTSLASTRISDGVAVKGSLRNIEATLPCTLLGKIEGVDSDAVYALEQAFGMIKRLGSGRNRGLGRCQISRIEPEKQDNVGAENGQSLTGSSLKFKCTLLSDVVLNQKSSSEGANTTLDFIPGANFLGIAASSLYGKLTPEQSLTVFHSGKVRFGDANPSGYGIRGLQVPLSMHYRKGSELKEYASLYHLYEAGKDKSDNGGPSQMKQSRKGFYLFHDNIASLVPTERSFSLKSAYDSQKRRPLDNAMFGYEALSKGLELYFEVEVDDKCIDDELKKKISDALCGVHGIGRSRSAQYGHVKIERFEFKEIPSRPESSIVGTILVYADSRLIFLDDAGFPTLKPSAGDIGVRDHSATINWDKSQVRMFRYSPWNATRQCYDADRYGFEKGSVLAVETPSSWEAGQSAFIGAFNNEGFGKVIYNPEFLDPAENAENGEPKYHFLKDVSAGAAQKPEDKRATSEYNAALISRLEAFQEEDNEIAEIYTMVSKFVSDNKKNFSGEKFASQWGRIRAIASAATDDESARSSIEYYINHGIAREKWKKYGRKKALVDFMKLSANRRMLINLASQMQKESD